eukprot:1157247-Pelagomonas_calceolata.AAC.6
MRTHQLRPPTICTRARGQPKGKSGKAKAQQPAATPSLAPFVIWVIRSDKISAINSIRCSRHIQGVQARQGEQHEEALSVHGGVERTGGAQDEEKGGSGCGPGAARVAQTQG